MESNQSPTTKKRLPALLLLCLLIILISVWLALTPAGIDGKLHAVGYSVCHQLDSHSLSIGGRILPLCARCTGTFLGLLTTLIYLSSRKRCIGVPSKPKIVILVIFFCFFVLDGINSTLTLIPGFTPLYLPDNRLRLFSGLLFGIALANLVTPLWHQTLWADGVDKPALETWRDIAILTLLASAAGGLVLLDVSFLYYPVAILSTISILIILGMIYSLLWCIILKRENSLHHLNEGIRIFYAGMITAILQVGMMDLARLVITKTW